MECNWAGLLQRTTNYMDLLHQKKQEVWQMGEIHNIITHTLYLIPYHIINKFTEFVCLQTFYHIACILWPPLGVMVVWIIRLWLLQCLEDLWPYQTEPWLLCSMIQFNKGVLNLYKFTTSVIYKYFTKNFKYYIKRLFCATRSPGYDLTR